MMTAIHASHPTQPPSDVPRDLVALWRCGFCANRQHRSCPGAVRNPKSNRLILCYCCRTDPRCLSCGEQRAEEVDPKTWQCTDQLGCDERVRVRVQQSPIFQMIQQCKVEADHRRRAVREGAERITRDAGPEGDSFDEPFIKPKRPPRPSAGVCVCCSAPTKGGEFAPGHDAKFKSILRKAAKAGDMDAQNTLEARGW